MKEGVFFGWDIGAWLGAGERERERGRERLREGIGRHGLREMLAGDE